ncbi:MAG: single-stranded-DNA-specific exonuclease RecJ, partial [bacterium]
MRWQNYQKIDPAWQAEHSEYHPIVLQLLYNRGITKAEEIKEFLGDEQVWHDPFLFRNMQAACDLIIRHIKDGNKIVVYGDYDADGVTSSVVLVEVLNILKAKAEVWIPSRVLHGYGMNKDIIKELAERDIKLIISVDNGIRSKEEVALAKELGMEVIVTDHHTAPSDENDLPDCLIIDPILEQETYPFKYLSGVGVAFKLASALTELTKIDDKTKQNIKEKVLDVLAIGTVADCVKLYGENRLFVRQGLEMINKRRRLGLVELIRVAGIKDKINEWNIGWQISPRLNVAGRLDHANTAFELLITNNKEEAQSLAKRLHEKNIARQEITNKIAEQCQAMVEKDQQDDSILVCVEPESDEPWPEGVIGLVAGRLTERYSKPALVISKLDTPGSNSKFKGSARSIEQFSVVDAL